MKPTLGCSPRTRGWSPLQRRLVGGEAVLPAHAGMVPRPPCTGCAWRCAPRARGDGPSSVTGRTEMIRCSPRTRGWSALRPYVDSYVRVLPAHAGMVPRGGPAASRCRRAPRARGDGPEPHHAEDSVTLCSPRTRGWSRRRPVGDLAVRVLPAHAGMVPTPPAACRPRWGAPRARGDGPSHESEAAAVRVCSPRTRGWPHHRFPRRPVGGVLPAYAGVVSGLSSPRCWWSLWGRSGVWWSGGGA